MGPPILQRLVWLGEPQPAQASDRSGPDAQAPSGESTDLFAPPHHQRRDGKIKLENPEPQGRRRGFRSFANYRTRILFFCGKLNFYPQ